MADSVRFTETMSGWISPAGTHTHEAAASTGRQAGNDLLFTLVVITPDVDAMVIDPDHRAPVFGVVLAPNLHPAPLSVSRGFLDLFADASPDGRTLHMRYGLSLRAPDGATFWLRGIKEVVRRRPWPTVTADTTTLFVDIWDGDGPVGRSRWRGILRMGPGGVLMQGLSFRGGGGWFGLRGIFRYLSYYVRRVWRIYSGPRTEAPRTTGEVWP